MTEQTKQVHRKKLQGTVISNKMTGTVVVRVDRLVAHPIYKKRSTVSKNYMVHYEGEPPQEGDRLIIEETRPISKNKRWKAVK